MTTNTAATTRGISMTVELDCPWWCREDHSAARGLDDIWHTRDLARVDENNYVNLVLAAIDTVMTGNGEPEISIMFDGNFAERPGPRGYRWTVEELRRLATMCTAAADAMDALEQ